MENELLEQRKNMAKDWFTGLRDRICHNLEQIEQEADPDIYGDEAGHFKTTEWLRKEDPDLQKDLGGGVMAKMTGRVFEKAGVNISTVYGHFSEEFRKEIPGADENKGAFWASGISLVIHPQNPHIPAVHFNNRFICTQKTWFGGGGDLNPVFPNPEDTLSFHNQFKQACDDYREEAYEEYKAWCDRYFYIKHRQRTRGEGGIFFDGLNSGDWAHDFEFIKNCGTAFNTVYPMLVRRHLDQPWTDKEREQQEYWRGLYAEFNLIYDRGTRFGLMTGANPEAVLMSLPPIARWE